MQSPPERDQSEAQPFIQVHKTSKSEDFTMVNDRDGNASSTTTTTTTTTYQYLRYFFLCALCLQNSSYTLLRRFSTGILMEHVSDSSVLIGGELIKLLVSAFMSFFAPSFGIHIGTMPMPDGRLAHLHKLIKTSPKMAVPALVYYCMNRLSFVALRRIDAGTFTVVAQLKTLTTAAFSYLILRKTFSAVRVRSLIYLVCSVIVISEFAATHSTPSRRLVSDALLNADDAGMAASSVFLVGLLAVMTEVTLSGLISVYYQKVLQDDKRNLSAWDRNIQLATFSIILYFPTLHSEGYFAGWTVITVLVSILGALGGLLVAFSMKYTDAILKALATSAAIVLTSVLSWYLLNGPYGIPIAVSSISVVVAIFTYVTDGKLPWANNQNK
eukprot:CAMPEP_0202697846 /NCGR_PEP_ID=MMETSP1385-20130828/11144_1 /ASSEMBLY_ACC=CAM_ASM_000861 /TAXON_ID=933848 /ORGANISM="Elphidium margaritaceum" /LENGTH=383 /DNA_ID=CAMNT_0049354401 /DNA_START=102 /DNA_END=1253 /DNA_ORIENTATION=-